MTKKSLSVMNNDRFLIHVPRHRAEPIRLALMRLSPRPWVFLSQTNKDNPNYGFDIYISNEWGSYPDDKLYNSCLTFAKNLLAGEPKQPAELEILAEELPIEVPEDLTELAQAELLEEYGSEDEEVADAEEEN